MTQIRKVAKFVNTLPESCTQCDHTERDIEGRSFLFLNLLTLLQELLQSYLLCRLEDLLHQKYSGFQADSQSEIAYVI